MLVEKFGLAGSAPKAQKPKGNESASSAPAEDPPDPLIAVPADSMHEVVNAPLDFELKNLDADHAYLRKRQFDPKTIKYFGLGYCTKGMLAGRIAIPLHNSEGKLVGYAGRLTDEFDVAPESPVYVWPAERERNGIKHVFNRGHLLYHAHRIHGPVMDLVVVQDFHSVWRLYQAGIPRVVGIAADMPSLEQSEMIVSMVRPTGRIWLMTDGTKSGERCAEELFFDLGPYRLCRWVKLDNGMPADLEPAAIRELLLQE